MFGGSGSYNTRTARHASDDAAEDLRAYLDCHAAANLRGCRLIHARREQFSTQEGNDVTIYDTIDRNALAIIRKIYDRYNVPRIISARNLDFHWRKDSQEGDEQADAIKDLLRYVPGLLRIAEQHPDADYVSPPVSPEALAEQARPEGWIDAGDGGSGG